MNTWKPAQSADFIRTLIPASSDMPEPIWPDPVEHARVFVTETFPGDVDTAFDIACLNAQNNPDQAAYWISVAEACIEMRAELRRAEA